MSLTLEARLFPLRRDEDGTIRVGGTRVTLDTVVEVFNQGYSPERIVDAFPTLALADVYEVIGYYLRHKDEVEEYIAEGRRQVEIFAREHPEMFPTGVRERLLARKREMDQRGQ